MELPNRKTPEQAGSHLEEAVSSLAYFFKGIVIQGT